MGRLLLALAAAILGGCEPILDVPPRDAPDARAETVLRIATWNVHDLFDAEDRLLPPGTEDDVPSPSEVDAKLDAVAAVLARLAADVVLLQEVETRALAVELGVRAGYADARLVEGNDPRGIDVAVLSRPAIARYVSHASERDAAGRALWPRDCVEVHLAGGRAADRDRREPPQLAALRRRHPARGAGVPHARHRQTAIAAADPSAVVVAGGDLNDSSLRARDGCRSQRRWPTSTDSPPEATTWSSGARAERLDALLVARDECGRDRASRRGAWARRGARVDHPAGGARSPSPVSSLPRPGDPD